MGGLFGLCLSCVIILLFPTSSVHTDFQKELILTKDNFNSELSQGKLEIYAREKLPGSVMWRSKRSGDGDRSQWATRSLGYGPLFSDSDRRHIIGPPIFYSVAIPVR